MVVVKSPFSLFFKRASHTLRRGFKPWAPAAVGTFAFLFNMAGYFIFNYNSKDKKLEH
ncbi:hypothetical protein MACJ_003764 [Theileria orientalis]|uniref:Uncharacterized protein n=1 Tax=Theileria orientalis TaxID=68886 RepID=A0A976XJY4_THEOR|nr:hypothetical protein MACJ_003764 [Theileria orientalis]